MIFLVNGKPESGKTTFESIVQEIMGEKFCYKLSTIDFVKDVARMCGWNGEKTLINRKFLSDLKDLLTKWDDVPVKKIKEQIEEIKNDFYEYGVNTEDIAIFIDCREPQEIARLCKELNAKSVLITRAEVDKNQTSNHADAEVSNYNYDIIIENNGSLKDLAYKALDFIDENELYFPHWKNFEIDFFGKISYNKDRKNESGE